MSENHFWVSNLLKQKCHLSSRDDTKLNGNSTTFDFRRFYSELVHAFYVTSKLLRLGLSKPANAATLMLPQHCPTHSRLRLCAAAKDKTNQDIIEAAFTSIFKRTLSHPYPTDDFGFGCIRAECIVSKKSHV